MPCRLLRILLMCAVASLSSQPVVQTARAAVLPVGLTDSGLVVAGIPIPAGAEPTLVANLSMENLTGLAPKAGRLGRGRLRAVVYEVQEAAPPDLVVAFYRRTVPGLSTPMVPFGVVPKGNVSPVEGKRADSEPVNRAPAEDATRVLPYLRSQGYVAIRSEEVSRPAQVTVAVVDGTAVPSAVLDVVEGLRDGRDSGASGRSSTLLSPPKGWEVESQIQGDQIRLLLESPVRRGEPAPVIDVMRSLLSQARSCSHKKYLVARQVPAVEVLAACAQEARQNRWRLLSVQAETPVEVTALYRLPEDGGMVYVRAERGSLKNVAPADSPVRIMAQTTAIHRLEVKGPINLQSLFRPAPVRPTPAARPPIPLPLPRGPFSAQPKR